MSALNEFLNEIDLQFLKSNEALEALLAQLPEDITPEHVRADERLLRLILFADQISDRTHYDTLEYAKRMY
jgi:hypothetical protein